MYISPNPGQVHRARLLLDGSWLSLHTWGQMDPCFRVQEDIGISKIPGISQSTFSPSQFPRTPFLRRGVYIPFVHIVKGL